MPPTHPTPNTSDAPDTSERAATSFPPRTPASIATRIGPDSGALANRRLKRRILLLDDHVLFRRALAHAFRATGAGYEIQETSTVSAMLTALDRESYDLVTLDLRLPGVHGGQALGMLKERQPAPVLVLSGHISPAEVMTLVADGASAIIPKSASLREVMSAAGTAMAGGIYIHPSLAGDVRERIQEGFRQAAGVEDVHRLSPREAEVLELTAQGHANREIASTLTVSTRTVERHKRAVSRKLGLPSVRHLPMWLAQQEATELAGAPTGAPMGAPTGTPGAKDTPDAPMQPLRAA